MQTQLGKYREYIRKNAQNLVPSFFVLAPNYNHINLDGYKNAKDYKVVNYSLLRGFFASHECSDDIAKPYYGDFVSALAIHSKEVDNSNFEIMLERLKEAIGAAKEEKL